MNHNGQAKVGSTFHRTQDDIKEKILMVFRCLTKLGFKKSAKEACILGLSETVPDYP